MNRSVIEELSLRFHDEQDGLVNLQDKTVARLHFLEGAIYAIETIKGEKNARLRKTRRDREEVKRNLKATASEAQLQT
jgi:hypothetical protein